MALKNEHLFTVKYELYFNIDDSCFKILSSTVYILLWKQNSEC